MLAPTKTTYNKVPARTALSSFSLITILSSGYSALPRGFVQCLGNGREQIFHYGSLALAQLRHDLHAGRKRQVDATAAEDLPVEPHDRFVWRDQRDVLALLLGRGALLLGRIGCIGGNALHDAVEHPVLLKRISSKLHLHTLALAHE